MLIKLLCYLCCSFDGDFFVIPTSCRRHLVQSKKQISLLKQAWTDKFVFYFAERRGFEPRKPFWSLHAFQACLFNHSSISPSPRRGYYSKSATKVLQKKHIRKYFGIFFEKINHFMPKSCFALRVVTSIMACGVVQ